MKFPKITWIHRVVGLLLTLWIGSIAIFFISKNVQVDIVEKQLALEGINPETTLDYQQRYFAKYQTLKQDLPLFYFEILPSHHCANKRQFPGFATRQAIVEAENEGYDCSVLDGSRGEFTKAGLKKKTFSYPTLVWYGANNQYHKYLQSLAGGKLGVSTKDGKEVIVKILGALKWTMAVVILNFTLGLLISVLLAVWMWRKQNTVWDKSIQTILHAVYSIPGFWLATLVLIFFTGPQYGMPIFYTPLYIPSGNEPWWEVAGLFTAKIAPVVFCLTLQDVALLTRLIRSKIETAFHEPFMDVLITRGTPQSRLVYQHALPNVLLPLITLFFNSLPAALAGSLVYEVVFNIPGMGRLLSDSIQAADWPVVYGISLLTLCLTVIIYSLGDLAYKWADPRIR